jgi:hypothetical protein
MDDMQYTGYPDAPGSPEPRPFGEVFNLWFEVHKMTEGFFAREAPYANSSATLFGLLIYAVFSAVLTLLNGLIGDQAQIEYLLSEFGGEALAATSTLLMCYLCVGFVSVFLSFYFGNALTYLGARVVGGTGSYATQTYLVSLFVIPLGLVGQLLYLIPFVGFFISLVIGIYTILLNIRALKVAHELTTGRAVFAALWPGLLVLLFACCLVIFLVMMGPAIGNVFQEIIEGMPAY